MGGAGVGHRPARCLGLRYHTSAACRPCSAGIDLTQPRLCSASRTPRTPSFTPLTRAAGLARLHGFKDQTATGSARECNTDAGPSADLTTSALSPYRRRRLVLEREAVAAAVSTHGRAGAEHPA